MPAKDQRVLAVIINLSIHHDLIRRSKQVAANQEIKIKLFHYNSTCK